MAEQAQFSQGDNVYLRLYGPEGNIKDERSTHNLVLTSGKNWLASFLAGTNTSNMVEMAIGTSTTAVTAGDTILGAEVSNPRVVGTTFASQNLWQLTATFAANNPSSTATVPITEGGIFNHNIINTGSMYVHATWAAINKAPADTLTVVWQVTNS
jgi:hypothetical protein